MDALDLHRPAPGAGSNIRMLTPRQRHRLRELHAQLAMGDLRLDRSARVIVHRIARILRRKAALLEKRGGVWLTVAESTRSPVVPAITPQTPVIGRRHADESCTAVEGWHAEGRDWTIVPIGSRRDRALALSGDWSLCAAPLAELARHLALADYEASIARRGRVLFEVHRLTARLARDVGAKRIATRLLDAVARTFGARIGAVALEDDDRGRLRIIAAQGLALAHTDSALPGPDGDVLGLVHRTHSPLIGRASVMRRHAGDGPAPFLAVPLLSGYGIVGVLGVWDPVGGRAFTRSDVSIARVLAAPAALALSRERAWSHARLFEHAAMIDPLTGLYNRRYFDRRVQEEMERSQRYGTPLSLLMIDVDDFKSVNDACGHLVGDDVIRQIAAAIRQSVRVFDVCVRYGGEEFAVIMPGGGIGETSQVAERVRQRIARFQPAAPQLNGSRLSISVGLATAGADVSIRSLVACADAALYEAKRAGKNRVRVAGELEQVRPAS